MPEYWGPGEPWLSIADMNQGRDLVLTSETITAKAIRDCNMRKVQPGTVLLSFKLSIGKVGIARVPMYTNEAIAQLPIRDGPVLAPYLAWALSSIDLGRTDRAAMGATLNSAKLRKIAIPVPPLAQQQRIVDILDRVESLRATRRKTLARLDELKHSTLAAMLGDPWGSQERWPRVSVAEILAVPLRNGTSPSREGTTQIDVLTLSAVTGAAFSAQARKKGTFKVRPAASQFVDPLDLLICRGNGNLALVGKARYPTTGLSDVLFPDTIIAARFDQRRTCREYIEEVWNSPWVRDQIEAGARTTNGTHKINQSVVEGIGVPLPPMDVQFTFAKSARELERLRSQISWSGNGLERLLTSIQYRAFAAEL